jgi:hypothetical protein
MKKTKRKATKKAAAKIASPVYTPSRRIPELTRMMLCTRAGGRCEFDGCSRYLLEHHVRLTEGNFAEFAHIVAFSENGPRGGETRPANIHDASNLMLLCPTCHKEIDDHPARYSRATLESYKSSHEAQIFHLTGLRPDMKTTVVAVKTNVGDQTVAVPFDHVLEAISPRYPYSKAGFPIDLTQLSTRGKSFTEAACEAIEEQVRTLLSAGGEFRQTGHISLFALGQIPVLMFLGSKLSNKVPVDVFQRHRDDERWKWKTGSEAVAYEFRKLRVGSMPDKVAVVLSLSGSIGLRSLPPEIDEKYTVYEITLDGATPAPTFLRTRADLDAFKVSYHAALGTIAKHHPALAAIDVFPAVPAPIAVVCGRELLPRVHPALRVYDNDKAKGGFSYQLTLNQ